MTVNNNYKNLPEEEIEYISVAAIDELPAGKRMVVEIDGETIVVFNLAGSYYAIGDLCTHDDGPVAEGDLVGESIECPRHGARFALQDGKALSLPAVVDIPAYPVRLQGDEIQIGVPRAWAEGL